MVGEFCQKIVPDRVSEVVLKHVMMRKYAVEELCKLQLDLEVTFFFQMANNLGPLKLNGDESCTLFRVCRRVGQQPDDLLDHLEVIRGEHLGEDGHSVELRCEQGHDALGASKGQIGHEPDDL